MTPYNRGGYNDLRAPNAGGGWFKGFQGIVDVLMRFSHLLDANCQAMNMSFMSLAGLFHRLGELKQMFVYGVETFALFKLLQKWRGKTNQIASELSVNAFNEFQPPDTRTGSRSRGLFILAFALFISVIGPIILARLLGRKNQLQQSQNTPTVQEVDDTQGEEDEEAEDEEREWTEKARALYTFEGRSQDEISFNEGDVVDVVARPFPDWWEGCVDGRRGLFPSNYVEIIEEPSSPNA
jgi:hypothetical protein